MNGMTRRERQIFDIDKISLSISSPIPIAVNIYFCDAMSFDILFKHLPLQEQVLL